MNVVPGTEVAVSTQRENVHSRLQPALRIRGAVRVRYWFAHWLGVSMNYAKISTVRR